MEPLSSVCSHWEFQGVQFALWNRGLFLLEGAGLQPRLHAGFVLHTRLSFVIGSAGLKEALRQLTRLNASRMPNQQGLPITDALPAGHRRSLSPCGFPLHQIFEQEHVILAENAALHSSTSMERKCWSIPADSEPLVAHCSCLKASGGSSAVPRPNPASWTLPQLM